VRELTEFQRRAALVALRQMFNDDFFSICAIRSIAEMLDIEYRLRGPDWEALRLLHCVPWSRMGNELAEQVRAKSLELLSAEPLRVEIGQRTESTNRIHVRLLP